MKNIFITALVALALHLSAQSTQLQPAAYPDGIIENFLKNLPTDSLAVQTLIPELVSRGNNSIHFPYPIIFVHGLVGSADSWVDFYKFALSKGWYYGGWIDFCLNADDNDAYCNIYPNQVANDIANFTPELQPADFYLINFKEDRFGNAFKNSKFPDDCRLSNQAAITKQGVAIREAVRMVLKATGKDKVILFGHSMGGLAIRQYVQNVNFWQQDGEHHVAKVITSGTPHGGSNSTSPAFLKPLGIDQRSDAVRDLRTNYLFSLEPGVFLFGGYEKPEVLDDFALGAFYNDDVNCNGQVGNYVQGLNFKTMPKDFEFSCITGERIFAIGDNGDDVVSLEKAKIKNYFNLYGSEQFRVITDSYTPLHINLPSFTKENILVLDEPDYFEWAYNCEFDQLVCGHFTKQAQDANYSQDYDDFTFRAPSTGRIFVRVQNVPLDYYKVNIYNDAYSLVKKLTLQGDASFFVDLPKAGQYYFELEGVATENSWLYPYNFNISFQNTVATADLAENRMVLFPNPTNSIATITGIDDIESIQIFDIIGKEHEVTLSNNSFDVSNLVSGNYWLKVVSKSGKSTLQKLIRI